MPIVEHPPWVTEANANRLEAVIDYIVSDILEENPHIDGGGDAYDALADSIIERVYRVIDAQVVLAEHKAINGDSIA